MKLYGFKETFLRIIKMLLYRSIGFRWEKCFLMSRCLDYEVRLPVRDEFSIKELVLSDYDDELWKDFLTGSKLDIYNKRFKNEKAKAYGLYVNGKLAYSIWILYGAVIFSDDVVLFEDKDCALLLDGYCLPIYRGMGLHNYMIQWCLNKMIENGVKKSYTVMLTYNIPSLRTMRKCGLDIDKTFYVYMNRGKIHVNKEF